MYAPDEWIERIMITSYPAHPENLGYPDSDKKK